MAERKRFAEMAGEQLREAGLLVLMFAPLYKFFEGSKAETPVLLTALTFGLCFMLQVWRLSEGGDYDFPITVGKHCRGGGDSCRV